MEKDEKEYVTLRTSGGEKKFERVASIELGGRQYAVLAPAESVPGLDENQALVFEVSKGEGEMARLNIVTDPALIERIFQEYMSLRLRENEERARNKGGGPA